MLEQPLVDLLGHQSWYITPIIPLPGLGSGDPGTRDRPASIPCPLIAIPPGVGLRLAPLLSALLALQLPVALPLPALDQLHMLLRIDLHKLIGSVRVELLDELQLHLADRLVDFALYVRFKGFCLYVEFGQEGRGLAR